MCTIKIDILPQALFEEIQISYSVQQPIKVSPQVEFFSNLSERTSVNCHCYLADNMEICSLNFTVMASFISSLGVPRTITKVAMLPINLALETCAAQKENEHKITININDSPVPLTVLFPGITHIITQKIELSANVMDCVIFRIYGRKLPHSIKQRNRL